MYEFHAAPQLSKSPAGKLDRAPIAILGVPFDNVNLAEMLAIAGEMIASRQPHYATTVGVDFIAAAMDDVELRRILFDAHLVLAEDKTVVWASKILGNALPESVTVPNLIPQLLAQAERKAGACFCSAAASAVAAKVQARHPKLELVGAYAPPDQPLLEMNHADIRRRLRAAKPDILLVAFGSPKQEKWINMNYREAGVPFVLGAGLTFDFLTGEGKPRQRAGHTILEIHPRGRAANGGGCAPERPPPSAADPMSFPTRSATSSSARRSAWTPRRPGLAGRMAARRRKQPCDVRPHRHRFCRQHRRGRARSGCAGAPANWAGNSFLSPRGRTVEAALKLMKLDEFLTSRPAWAGARIVMESRRRRARHQRRDGGGTANPLDWRGHRAQRRRTGRLYRVRTVPDHAGHDRGD